METTRRRVNYYPESRTNAFVALGSNQSSSAGGPLQTVMQAIENMRIAGFVIRCTSHLYTTLAIPAGTSPNFINAVVEIEADLTPEVILERLHDIESELGRERTVRWGARTVDLDLLAVGEEIRPDLETHNQWRILPMSEQIRRAPEQLILPHPRLQDRAFVLVPFADIAPNWVHPVLRQTVSQMLDALSEDDKKAVKRVE